MMVVVLVVVAVLLLSSRPTVPFYPVGHPVYPCSVPPIFPPVVPASTASMKYYSCSVSAKCFLVEDGFLDIYSIQLCFFGAVEFRARSFAMRVLRQKRPRGEKKRELARCRLIAVLFLGAIAGWCLVFPALQRFLWLLTEESVSKRIFSPC